MLLYSEGERWTGQVIRSQAFSSNNIWWAAQPFQKITTKLYHRPKYLNLSHLCVNRLRVLVDFNLSFHLFNDSVGNEYWKSNCRWYLKIACPLTSLIIQMKVVWRTGDESIFTNVAKKKGAARGKLSISLVIIHKRSKNHNVIILNDIESSGNIMSHIYALYP